MDQNNSDVSMRLAITGDLKDEDIDTFLEARQSAEWESYRYRGIPPEITGMVTVYVKGQP